jgi:hypothetical protein
MSKKTKKNVNNARQKKIDEYYDIFLKRYKYQLSLNQTADSPSLDERFENYSKIINTIAGETIVIGRTRQIRYNNNNNINNDFKNNVVLDLKNNKGEEEDKLKYYTIKIIKKILKVKENILINPIFKNMSLISTHGNVTTDFFKIPDNLIICILTPLNRLAIIGEEFVNNIIDKLKEPYFNNSFLSNPSCYLRDTENSFLEFATTFYPGQMCNDLSLSIDSVEKRNEMAYFKIDPSNPTTLPDTNIGASTNSTTLSELIKYKNISGILFVTCCRSCDSDVSLIEKTKKIYILETFTNILNKTIDNLEDSNYNSCNLLTKYEKPIGKEYVKARNINVLKYSQYPVLQTMKNKSVNIRKTLQTNSKIRNNALHVVAPERRTRHKYQQILVNAGDILHINKILFSNITYKEKYKQLNNFFNLDKIKSELNDDELNILIEIFKKSLNNNVYSVSYLVSYIFYNYSINHRLPYLQTYATNQLFKDTTGLFLSGDMTYIQIVYCLLNLKKFKFISIEFLDISDNNNLMFLPVDVLPKTLRKLYANNCNILFLQKSILNLNYLDEINLDGNPKLSFNKTSFDNIDSNNKYEPEEKECIKRNNGAILKMLSYDDPDFTTHPKYSIFLKYLIDYSDKSKIMSNTNTNNTNYTSGYNSNTEYEKWAASIN